MTIVLIAIVGLVLTSVARQSLELVAEALAAEEEVQRRWALFSCQRAILPRAESILFAEQQRLVNGGGNPGEARTLASSISVGPIELELVLADEEAKLNLNVLARRGGEQVRRAVEQLAPPGRADLRLRPYRRTADMQGYLAFDSWGQVFAIDQAPPVESSKAIAAITGEITCWGEERLNIRRATASAVEQVCQGEADPSTVRRLLEQRALLPTGTLAALLDPLQLSESDRRRLEGVLGDRSSCHSLWVFLKTPQRQDATLFVAAEDGERLPRVTCFAW
jgi:hypothetical protein